MSEYYVMTEVDTGTGRRKLTKVSTILDRKIGSLGTTHLMGGRDMGRPCVGYFYLDGVSVDAELMTINGRTYQFLMTATALTGDVRVDIQLDQTQDYSCTALAAAINADASRDVDAVVMAGNDNTTAGVMFIAIAAQATNYTLTEGCTNGIVSAATHTGAAVMANRSTWIYEYTVTAADVIMLALVGGNSIVVGGVNSTTEPVVTGLTLRDANGVIRSMATVIVTALQANTNYWVIAVDDPTTVLVAADILGFCLTV